MSKLIFISVNSGDQTQEIQAEIARLNIKNTADYYKEYFGASFLDLSFFMHNGTALVGYCACFKMDNKLCFSNEGIKLIFFTEQYSRDQTKQEKRESSEALQQIIEHIEQLALDNKCSEIVISDSLKNGVLSLLGRTLFNQRYHAQMTFEMDVDFTNFKQEDYTTSIRKSYRSLINWGRKNLETTIISKDNLLYDKFLQFKDFHAEISGRKTRSDESWDFQYKMLAEGHGELILADYEGKLAAGGLYIDQYDTSIYFTAVCDRSLFDYGVSHYLLYSGICNSFKRGKTKRFSLGLFDTDIKDQKWYNIQNFKRGYCDDLMPVVFWKKNLLEELNNA